MRLAVMLVCQNSQCNKTFPCSAQQARARRKFCSKPCADQAFRLANHSEILAKKAKYRKEHRVLLRDKARQYYAEHSEEISAKALLERDKISIKNKRYYRENHKAELIRARMYRLSYPEKIVESRQVYENKNAEKIKIRRSAYRKTHPEQHRINQARRRAKKAAAPINDFTTGQWLEILNAYHYRCVYCPDTCRRCRQKKHALTQDHIIPLSKGGSHTASNIVPACRSCNSKKSNRSPLKPVQPLLLTTV